MAGPRVTARQLIILGLALLIFGRILFVVASHYSDKNTSKLSEVSQDGQDDDASLFSVRVIADGKCTEMASKAKGDRSSEKDPWGLYQDFFLTGCILDGENISDYRFVVDLACSDEPELIAETLTELSMLSSSSNYMDDQTRSEFNELQRDVRNQMASFFSNCVIEQ